MSTTPIDLSAGLVPAKATNAASTESVLPSAGPALSAPGNIDLSAGLVSSPPENRIDLSSGLTSNPLSDPDEIPPVNDPNEGTLGKIWDFASKPLLDLHRQGAGPIESGIENFASGLSSPLSVSLLLLTGGLGSLAEGAGADALSSFAPEIAGSLSKAAGTIGKLMNAGFTAQQIYSTARALPQLSDAIKSGDTDRALQLGTEAILGAGAAGLSAMHLTRGLRSEPFSWEGNHQAIGEYQSKVEEGNIRARQFEQANKELIHNKNLDQAAQFHLEAGGNNEVLEKWRQDILNNKNVSDRVKGRYDSILQLAQSLPQNVKDLASQLHEDYANDWQRGQQLGIFNPEAAGRPNYAGQHEYNPNDADESNIKPSSNYAGKKPDFAKARRFDTLSDAIQAGFEPVETGLATARGKYIRRLAQAEGVRNAEAKLQQTTSPKDGAPIAVNPAKLRTVSGQYIDSYPTRLFHGTSAGVDSVTDLRPDEFGNVGRLGQGAYFSLSPQISSKYAGGEVAASGGRVVAGELQDGVKILDADAALPKKLQTALGANADTSYGQLIQEAISNREDITPIQKAVADAGYDGVESQDVHGSPSIMLYGEGVTGRPLSDVIDPTVPTAERAWGEKGKNIRAVPVPQGADLDMLANSGRLIVGENGKRYIDVSDYKEGPDKFNLWRVKQSLFDDQGERVPVFERQNLLVHPDYHKAVMQAFQDTSWFRQNAVAEKVLKASTQAKKSLLSLSPFHWVTEGLRGLQMGLNPAEVLSPKPIDSESLAVTEGTKHGLTLLGDSPGRNQFAEGVAQHSAWVQKIPVLGNLLASAEDKLFSDYIPRLKALSFEKLSDQLAKKNPEWSDAQVYKTASELTNSAFGGLNYKQLGLSLSGQDGLRLAMLAPDFTGSQLLFAKSGFQPGGSAVWQSFGRIALYNAAVAQLLNLMIGGKVRMDHPFSVVSPDDKNLYSIRTMPEDIAHLLTDPRSFTYNRLNPVTTKPAVEFLTGKDQRGRNADYGQQVADLLRNVIPISLSGFTQPTPGAGVQQFERGFGVGRTQNRSAAETLALQRASAKDSQGAIPQSELAAHHQILQLTDQLRQGQINPRQVIQAMQQGQISRRTASKILADSRMTPLASSVANLPMSDSLDVYSVATPQERAGLLPILRKKIENFMRTETDRTPEQNRFIAYKIRKVLGIPVNVGALAIEGAPTHVALPGVGIQPIQPVQ
jgi:hypothetical protein